MSKPVSVNRHTISLYPSHVRAVARKAREAGIIDRARYFSPALQLIIEEWAELKAAQEQQKEKVVA